MVPFSFPQPLLKSRVMNKYISSSATVGVWAPGAWSLELDVFILSCFPAFLILISVPVFPSCPSFPSVFKNRGPRCRSSADVDHRPSRWFGSRCFCPILASCFPYGHSGRCKNPNEFAKIKVNQGKSNLFFLFQLLTPKF
jgi:hypothetical protein